VKRRPIRAPLLALLPIVLFAGAARAQGEPDAGDLLRQGLEQIAGFNTERLAAARKAELARFLPAGRTAEVTLNYRVFKPAPAEGMEIAVLDDLLPFPVPVLAERNVKYRQETVRIVGTGEYVAAGAPAYPELRQKGQVGWIEWNQWREKSAAWAEERRQSLPPDEFQVHDRGTEVRRAGLESVVAPPQPVPQVDAAWFERSGQLLAALRQEARARPNPRIGEVCHALEEARSAASEPAWSPQPGGILLSPAAAGELGDGLSIERVEYDESSGTVRVLGGRSAVALDRDLLATTLRLAFGTGTIPYFSLDPHDPLDEGWAQARDRASDAISERLRSDGAFRERFLERSFAVNDTNDAPHRVAFLEEIDPELARELDRTLPMRMDLVFRPRWLARTRLGELLFLADQSLKELWHGAAVWSHAPSRALAVEGRIPPKFWEPRNPGREMLAEALGRSLASFGSARWWFTPGGEVRDGEGSLDLRSVQPFLQRERLGGNGTATIEYGTPIPGLTVKREIVIDPFAQALAGPDDPWGKRVVEHVNANFEDYARAIPEWEALREVFRAYVLAIWLQRHDPGAGRRLLADLPPPLPPRKPLPKVWPDPRLLVVRTVPDAPGFELEQAVICGGVGFERPFLRAAALSGASSGASRATRGTTALLASLGSDGFTPEWSDDDAPATPEGYAAWRHRLLTERGLPWIWFQTKFDPRELLAFAGVALLLALVSLWKGRRAGLPFTGKTALAALLDLLATTLVLAIVAVYPSVYEGRKGPFTGWFVAVGFYAFVFLKGDRPGRFGVTVLVMTIVLIWSLFSPGAGELVAGWTPARLARPPIEGTPEGPLAADTVYTLQALEDGLAISRSLEPRHAFYPLLWLLAVLGAIVDPALAATPRKKDAAGGAGETGGAGGAAPPA